MWYYCISCWFRHRIPTVWGLMRKTAHQSLSKPCRRCRTDTRFIHIYCFDGRSGPPHFIRHDTIQVGRDFVDPAIMEIENTDPVPISWWRADSTGYIYIERKQA